MRVMLGIVMGSGVIWWSLGGPTHFSAIPACITVCLAWVTGSGDALWLPGGPAHVRLMAVCITVMLVKGFREKSGGFLEVQHMLVQCYLTIV